MTSVCFRSGSALNQHMLIDLEDADDDADVMICTLTWKITVDLGIRKKYPAYMSGHVCVVMMNQQC